MITQRLNTFSPAVRRPSWWMGRAMLTAALLVAGLLALALLPGGTALPAQGAMAPPDEAALLRAHRPAPPSGPDLTVPTGVTANNWTSLFPPLSQISAASATEAWAPGENAGELLHFTAGTWTTVTPTVLSGLRVGDVEMFSATLGWATADSGTAGYAYRYDGTTWTDMSAGLGANLRAGVIAWRGGQSNLWATGQACPAANQCHATLVHWDGSTWAAAGPTLPATGQLWDIDLTSPGEGWAVGPNNGAPLVLHYDGLTWSPIPGPAGATYLQRVAGVGGGQAWATGLDSATSSNHLYHYDGTSWTDVPVPDGSGAQDVFVLTPTQGWLATTSGVFAWNGVAWTPAYTGRALHAVSAVTGAVWAAGDAGTIAGQSGSGPWALQRGGPTTEDLLGVSALSTNDAWAVGGHGTFVHYQGGAWQAVTTPFTGTIWAVQMLSPTDGYAVGDDLIAHWDGTTWGRVAGPLNGPAGMYALAMTGSGEGWAAGSRGFIWHATGGVWSQWPERPTNQFLLGITMDSPDHGWAVGGTTSGKVLEYTGGSWVDRSSTLPPGVPSLKSVTTGPGPDEAWAGVWSTTSTNAPALLHYQAGVWDWVPGVTGISISAFAHEALGELWTVGYPSYHYSNGAWQPVGLPAYIVPLEGVALVPGRGGWAVGAAGQILQYDPLAPGQRFYDVPLGGTFAPYIEYMAAHNIVSGYSDNTFRPTNNITRGQLAKMAVAGMGWPLLNPAVPTFNDVPTAYPFYSYIETAVNHGVISGYTCGGPGEPCPGLYYRPGNNVTRGQLTKIIVNAKGWGPATPAQPTFADVPAAHPFYGYIEQAVAKGVISGYTCGAPGEPCPYLYFRPANSATRGQLSKILYLALTQP